MKEYHDNGQLAAEYSTRSGIQDERSWRRERYEGEYRAFDESWKPLRRETYKDGRLEGARVVFASDGYRVEQHVIHSWPDELPENATAEDGLPRFAREEDLLTVR